MQPGAVIGCGGVPSELTSNLVTPRKGVNTHLVRDLQAHPYWEIGQRISDARVEAGRREGIRLTQQKIADAVGVHVGTVTAWETGKQRPEGENLVRLASRLGVDATFLMEGREGSHVFDRPRVLEYRFGDERDDLSSLPQRTPPVEVQAEEWLSKIIAPDMLRRLAGTPTYLDVLYSVQDTITRRTWPPIVKNQVRALVDQMIADAQAAES